MAEGNLYWGEVHTHTSYSDGQGTPEEAAREARAHLDFWACADHICSSAGIPEWHEKFMANWDNTRQAIAAHNQPHEFVTLPAYEYTSIGGDFNIYFPGDCVEPYLPDSVADFARYAAASGAILIPHHTGYIAGVRGMDWDDFVPEVMPLVEVFSMHGSSEVEPGPYPMNLHWMAPRESAGTVQEGLDRGCRFGLMASSDGHGGYPGNYLMGLTAVCAPELTREAVFEALRDRRCYGVTGDRIKLDFGINGTAMGGETTGQQREISFSVTGMDAIERVEVVKNGRVLLSRDANGESDDRYVVRLEWGWGNYKNKLWEGHLQVAGGAIVEASPNFGSPGPNRIESLEANSCTWRTHVDMSQSADWRHCRNGREATQQIVFVIAGDETTRLAVVTRGHKLEATVGQLLGGSVARIVDDSEFGAKFKFHAARRMDECEASGVLLDDDAGGTDYYYLRVVQANGQMAWSSPVWVEA